MPYTTGEFAEHTGLSAHTLRFYEKEGLLSPARDSSGRRAYTEEDADWVAFIRQLKDTGMQLEDIKRYAVLRAEGDSTLSARRDMLQKHREGVMQEISRWWGNLSALDEEIAYYDVIMNRQNEE